jgi:hypothetical protein
MGFALITHECFWGHYLQYLGEGYYMQMTQFEIFRNSRHGASVRITTVETLGQVEQTLHALAWFEPGDYFTRDCTTGEILAGRRSAAS